MEGRLRLGVLRGLILGCGRKMIWRFGKGVLAVGRPGRRRRRLQKAEVWGTIHDVAAGNASHECARDPISAVMFTAAK